MGDRGQICVQSAREEKVYLYTHWDGHNLKNILGKALSRRERFDDSEYLARIIFCTMIKGKESGETGFGIGVAEHGDLNNPLLVVDCSLGEIYEDKKVWAFNEFIQKYGVK